MERAHVLLVVLVATGCVAGREGLVGSEGGVGRDGSLARDGSVVDADGALADGSLGDASSRDAGSDSGTSRPDGSLPFFELACDDGIDADGDGLTDCADDDCEGAPCDLAGGVCAAGACGGCAGEPSETRCGDGVDDDCDGLVDCADPECAGVVCGPGDVVCGAGACPCPSGFVERACADVADDDCDGLIDCEDPDCAGRACTSDGMLCSAGACTCGESVEFCNDRDEDCDGVADDGCPRALSVCCPSSAGSYGSSAGIAFSDPCPAGTVLMGIAGRAGARLEQIQPICAQLVIEVDREGRPDFGYPVRRGAPVLGATHGGTLGTAFDDRCPGDDVVIGVRGSGDDLTGVGSIALACGTVSVARFGFSFRLQIAPSIETPTRGSASTTPFRADCASGAIGELSGRASTRIERLAFTCRRLVLETL